MEWAHTWPTWPTWTHSKLQLMPTCTVQSSCIYYILYGKQMNARLLWLNTRQRRVSNWSGLNRICNEWPLPWQCHVFPCQQCVLLFLLSLSLFSLHLFHSAYVLHQRRFVHDKFLLTIPAVCGHNKMADDTWPAAIGSAIQVTNPLPFFSSLMNELINKHMRTCDLINLNE